MIRIGHDFGDPCGLPPMAEKTFDLRGLKCPLPVLRTRKALAGMRPGDILVVACTDPLAAIDIPTLLARTGDILEAKHGEAGATIFRIRKN
jgi:tRNA 2-thiouridine synthesizing protein A